LSFFSLLLPRSLRSSLFPYTTLFRSPFLSASCGFTSGSVKRTNFARRRSFRFSTSWEHFCLSHLASGLPEEDGSDCSLRRLYFLSHRSRLKPAMQPAVTRIFL